MPFVPADVLPTYNKPFVELTEAFAVVKFNKLPVVNALAETVNAFCVDNVDQFHVCAKFVLSIVFVAVADVNDENATEFVLAGTLHVAMPVASEVNTPPDTGVVAPANFNVPETSSA